MEGNAWWHGGLFALVLALPTLAANPPPDHQIPKVQTRSVEIEYRVNEAALPLTRVELWYSRDNGDSWQRFGVDEDRQSPLVFEAPEEGLYAFYVIAENRMGASSPPPSAATLPQQWAFVDFTPPIVQLHPVQVQQPAGGREQLQVRWTAIDANFDARPITLSYRLAPDGEWAEIGERLANTGRFDWTPPEQLEGRVVVRLTVTDRSGHRVSAVTRAVDLIKNSAGDAGLAAADTSSAAEPAPAALDAAAEQRAEALFRRGVLHKERGEYRLAAARFQDALAINPHMPEALVNLGETLYFREEYADSIEAFEWAVKFEPGWTEARRGLVRSLMALNRYDAAAAHLGQILQQTPTDGAAWLTLGDVAMARGDELVARENWQKAVTLNPAAKDVVERAQSRLNGLRRVSPTAGQARK